MYKALTGYTEASGLALCEFHQGVKDLVSYTQ